MRDVKWLTCYKKTLSWVLHAQVRTYSCSVYFTTHFCYISSSIINKIPRHISLQVSVYWPVCLCTDPCVCILTRVSPCRNPPTFWTKDLLLSWLKILHHLLILRAPPTPPPHPTLRAKVFLPADKMLARLVNVATPVRRPMLVDPNRVVSNSAANCVCISQGRFVQNVVWFCNFRDCLATREIIVIMSSARVKERVELYLCSPSGPSWPVLGRALPLLYLLLTIIIIIII